MDLVPVSSHLWRAIPGGSPANTAIAASRLGASTTLLARISRDQFGARIREHLAVNKVGLQFATSVDEPTTLAVVTLDETGKASYSFHLDGTADWGWASDDLPPLSDGEVDVIHAGSMALAIEPGGLALETYLIAQRSHAIISIDPNVRERICPSRDEYRQKVERWVDFAHVIKASTDDLAWLYPSRTIEDVLGDWSVRGPALVVITRGDAGAVARTSSGQEVRVTAPAVRVVDSVGAGDTFSAVLLQAIDQQKMLSIAAPQLVSVDLLRSALERAVLAAAITCGRPGANSPHAAEMIAALG